MLTLYNVVTNNCDLQPNLEKWNSSDYCQETSCSISFFFSSVFCLLPIKGVYRVCWGGGKQKQDSNQNCIIEVLYILMSILEHPAIHFALNFTNCPAVYSVFVDLLHGEFYPGLSLTPILCVCYSTSVNIFFCVIGATYSRAFENLRQRLVTIIDLVDII